MQGICKRLAIGLRIFIVVASVVVMLLGSSSAAKAGFCSDDGQCCSADIEGNVTCEACGVCCALTEGCGEDPTCFLAGTEVTVLTATQSGGQGTGGEQSKKIEEIKVGDRVASFVDEVGGVVTSDVSQIYKSQRNYYYELSAGDNEGRLYSVKVTAEHPFYVGEGRFEQVQNLKIGDRVYVKEEEELIEKWVIAKRRVDERVDVYNMSVDGTQTYFANDFAVHNKYIWRPTCTNSVSPATPQLLCKNDGVGIGTNYRLTCDQYFPSLMATGDAWCYTGCTCCAATDTLACTTGANYTREAADISCANKYDIYVSVESRLTERVSA